MPTPAEIVAGLTPQQLNDVIVGRVRLSTDSDEQRAIWNAAIDRENGYDD